MFCDDYPRWRFQRSSMAWMGGSWWGQFASETLQDCSPTSWSPQSSSSLETLYTAWVCIVGWVGLANRTVASEMLQVVFQWPFWYSLLYLYYIIISVANCPLLSLVYMNHLVSYWLISYTLTSHQHHSSYMWWLCKWLGSCWTVSRFLVTSKADKLNSAYEYWKIEQLKLIVKCIVCEALFITVLQNKWKQKWIQVRIPLLLHGRGWQYVPCAIAATTWNILYPD